MTNKKKTAFLGLILAFSMILSYVESLIPFYFGMPGIKLGLANLAIVITLYLFGWKDALCLTILRVFLAGFMFGNFFMMMYSLAGAILSFLAMVLCKKTGKFSIVGVSEAGGVFHNIGQLLIAYFVTKTTGLIYYLPVLLAAGAVTGLLIGLLADRVRKHAEVFVRK